MREKSIIFITMLMNLFIAVTKLLTGIIFSFNTLISDSLQSFLDFFTDITCFFAIKIGRKKPDQKYPFGYGQVHSVFNLLTGLLLFTIGFYLFYHIFQFSSITNIDTDVFIILSLMLLMKYFVVYLLKKYGNRYDNQVLIESSKESFTDLLTASITLIVSLLIYFRKYIPLDIDYDKIGTIIMCLMVFYSSVSIMVHNIIELLPNTTKNLDLENKIRKLIEQNNIECVNIKIIKYYLYYQVIIKIEVNQNMIMKDYFKVSEKLKSDIKKLDSKIHFVNFNLVERK